MTMSGPPYGPPGADAPPTPPSIPGNPAWIPPESIPTPKPEDTLSPQEITAVNALIDAATGGGSVVTTVAGRTGDVVLTQGDITGLQAALDAKGTSNLVLGTTSTTAKVGDYQPTSANISDASTVGRSVLTAASQAAARTAIGAGTSSLALGATASTALAGNTALVPPTRTVNAKALSADVVLAAADIVATGYTIGSTALAPVTATDTLLAAIAKLEKRIADLEAAP